jgi:hypothetical protein
MTEDAQDCTVTTVAHQGCYDCKSTAQEILYSVRQPGDTMGNAVCDACAAKREK